MNVRPEPPDDQRCQFLWTNGNQCRSYREQGADHGYCKSHYDRIVREATSPEPLPAWVAGEILPADGKLDDAAAINAALTRVFRCVCEGRLSPRHAASLGYLGQLLISTLPGMERAAANQPPHAILGPDPDAALVKILHSLAEPRNSPHRALSAEPPAPPQQEAANGQAEKAG